MSCVINRLGTVALVLAFFGAALVAPQPTLAATVTVVNNDGPGEGFNDPTVVAPVGGNSGTTRGGQRLIAFQHAADIWGGLIASAVPIRVGAKFDPLTCSATSAILGSAAPSNGVRDFAGAPVAATYYPIALANALHGSDIDPGADDISAQFNSSIGTTCAFPSVWYYGLDASPPAGQIDFVSVLVHELGHGLGFLTFVDLETGQKALGYNDAFMRHLEDHGATPSDYPSMSDAQRIAASTHTGSLHWVGPSVRAASGALTTGIVGDHVRMYAPNPQVLGSSVSHWDTALTPNQIMEPSYTGPLHSPLLELALFQDIGWTLTASTVPAAPTIGTASAGNNSILVAFTAGAMGSGSFVSFTALCNSSTGVSGTLTSTTATSPFGSASIVVSGLTNGAAYACAARTTSTAGTSAWSAWSNSVVPGGVSTLPDAPTIGTAVPGNASIGVAFTPGAIGSGTLVNYWAACSVDNVNYISVSGANSPLNVIGLGNNIAYRCRAFTESTVGNSAWSVVSNSVTPSALPDLVITSVTAPASGQAGGNVYVTATLLNQGGVSAGASWIGFYLSTDATISSSDINTNYGCSNASLSPGQTFTCQGDIVVPANTPAGTYYLGAIADANGQVVEFNEGNNSLAAATTTVIGNALAPICTLAANPASVSKGGSSTLTASCSPAATSYSWTGGTCAGVTAAACIVTPAATTTYGVRGANAYGTSTATRRLTVGSIDLTPILMLLLGD